MEICTIFGTKTAHLSWTKFFGTNHCYYFHLPIRPFHCAKFKKTLKTDPELWVCAIFGPKMVHLPPPKQFFFGKLLISFSYYYPFRCAKFKKTIFQQIQSYENAQFLGPKWHISPNENFFRKPVNKPCFFHSCLSTCQKSKSDINLLVKYWRLKNTEISLAESHFWL